MTQTHPYMEYELLENCVRDEVNHWNGVPFLKLVPNYVQGEFLKDLLPYG